VNEEYKVFVELAGLFLTIFAAVWSLALWISGQFTKVRGLIYETAEKTSATIMAKLEYHEKHDDARFSSLDNRIVNIRDDLWGIQMRNAAIRGLYLSTDDDTLTPVSKKVKKLLKEETL